MGHVWLVMEWRLETQGKWETDLGRSKEMEGCLGKGHMTVPPLSSLWGEPRYLESQIAQPSMLHSNRISFTKATVGESNSYVNYL